MRIPARTWAFAVLIFLAALAPWMLSPVAPTIDFYDHVSRYFVLSRIDGSAFLQANYAAKWSLLPNIGLDLVGTPILGRVDGLTGARIMILVVFTLQYFGLLFFNIALTRRLNLLTAVLAAPLLYSFILRWGFANFLTGLGLVFWGAGLWLFLRHKPLIAMAVGIVAALVIFITHGVAFGLYGVLLGGLELGFFWRRQTTLPQLARNLAILASQAVTPAVLFVLSATAKSPQGVSNAGGAVSRLSEQGRLVHRLFEIGQYRLTTIARVAEGPSLAFDLATFAVTGLLMAWLIARGRVAPSKVAWPALALGVLLVLLMPPALFGVGYVADRMPLFVGFLTVASLSAGSAPWTRGDRVVVGLVAAVVALRVAVVSADWMSYRPDLAAYTRVVGRLPPQQVVGFVNANLEPRQASARRCEMFGPLLASQHGQAAALFAIPYAQPLDLKGQLALSLRDLPAHAPFKGDEARAYYNDTLAAMGAQKRFDYVLVCDPSHLGGPAPAGLGLVAQDGRFGLYKVIR